MKRTPTPADALGAGAVLGLPGTIIAGKAFCWAVPLLTAALDWLL